MSCRHERRPCFLCKELANLGQNDAKQSKCSANFILKRPESLEWFAKRRRWRLGRKAAVPHTEVPQADWCRTRRADSFEDVALPRVAAAPHKDASLSLEDVRGSDAGSLESIPLGGSAGGSCQLVEQWYDLYLNLYLWDMESSN